MIEIGLGIAERCWPGGTEGVVAVTRRGLFDGTEIIEWRCSPRSSSDPNMGSWRGYSPAGYEVGEGNPRRAELHLGAHEHQQAGKQDDDDQN